MLMFTTSRKNLPILSVSSRFSLLHIHVHVFNLGWYPPTPFVISVYNHQPDLSRGIIIKKCFLMKHADSAAKYDAKGGVTIRKALHRFSMFDDFLQDNYIKIH